MASKRLGMIAVFYEATSPNPFFRAKARPRPEFISGKPERRARPVPVFFLSDLSLSGFVFLCETEIDWGEQLSCSTRALENCWVCFAYFSLVWEDKTVKDKVEHLLSKSWYFQASLTPIEKLKSNLQCGISNLFKSNFLCVLKITQNDILWLVDAEFGAL